MDRAFFGTPFKAVMLALLILSLGSISFDGSKVDAQNWDEDRLMMDMQSGGAELFKEISSSIIQIYNIDYVNWGGGAGSGYVIDKEGHAITNKHVVGDSLIVEIAFFGDEDTGDRCRAVVVGEDPSLDLAILKIETTPDKLHPIKLGDSDLVQVGDVVATCGSPGGDAGSIDPSRTGGASDSWLDFFNFNIGVVDEIFEFRRTWLYFHMDRGYMTYGQYYGSNVQYLFHVSAAINHGNSGGPCINSLAEAIGTNTWGGGGENVGMSVPTNFLKRSAAEIIQYGRAMTPWCGILCHPQQMPYKWAFFDSPLGLTNEWGLWFDVEVENPVIEHINPYSPAAEAGLRVGDVILTVDNKEFHDVFELYKYFLNGRIGQEVTFIIERNGTGIPPITLELAEKKVRFDNVTIDSYTMGGGKNPYSASLTY